MKIASHTDKKKNFFRHLTGFWSEDRNLSLLFGFILFDFFVLPSLTGLIGERLIIDLLNNLVFSLLLLFGVLALTRLKAIQLFFALIVALIIIVRWIRLITGLIWLAEWDIILSIISSIAFVTVILSHVFREGPVSAYRIQGAIAAYIMIAMVFALGFFLIEFLIPGSFQFPNPVRPLNNQSWKIFYYFSICNLTTLGYGDITPLHPLARSLVMIEAITGQMYPVILLAHLVSLHTHERLTKKHNN
jgi:hypothetical protein